MILHLFLTKCSLCVLRVLCVSIFLVAVKPRRVHLWIIYVVAICVHSRRAGINISSPVFVVLGVFVPSC